MPGQNQPRTANVDNIELLSLVGAAANVNGDDKLNLYSKGLTLVIDVTDITGTTPSIVVTLEGKDPVTGKYYTILETSAISTVSTTVLKVYPGINDVANSSANFPLPKTYRVNATIAGTTPSVTAKVGASLHL